MAAFGALDALSEVDAERATVYHDVIDQHLNAAAKTALEEMMETKWEYQSNFAKKYIGIGRAEGKAEGKAEGELAGEARGKAEGKAEGRVEKQRQTLTKLIKLRLGEPDASTLARLQAASEDDLDLWTERILTAETLSELFA
jgi:hypothetical protein